MIHPKFQLLSSTSSTLSPELFFDMSLIKQKKQKPVKFPGFPNVKRVQTRPSFYPQPSPQPSYSRQPMLKPYRTLQIPQFPTQNVYIEALTPIVNAFGDKAFKEVTEVK